MIDLAPHNPYGLSLQSPVIIAPGCGSSPRDHDPSMIGAIATTTALLHRPDVTHRRWGAVPAGVVYERLPTIAFRALLQQQSRRWLRSPIPVLVTLRGTPEELLEMTTRLLDVEGVAGILVHIDESPDVHAQAVAAVRDQTAVPLLVMLESSEEAEAIVAAGADALVALAYPSGCAPTEAGLVEGMLIGPTLLPRTLSTLARLRTLVDVPLIALGGVADESLAHACLEAGASAVMIDAALYGDPHAPRRIANGLQGNTARDAASA